MHIQENDTPSVSVIMGVLYKRESLSLLRRSVESVLKQSFMDFELLICDEGSSQQAMNLLEKYTEQDPRVRLIRPGNKIDLASKLNACLKEARGKYIARMDDDDYSYTLRFQKQLSALKRNEQIAFVGCNVNLWCEGKIVGSRAFPAFPQVKDFYMTQPFIHPSLVFLREALEAVGGYSEHRWQVLCEDYDLLLRLYAKGHYGMNLEEPLLDYTISTDGKGSRRMRHRWNEAVTRYTRFKELGVLPKALPYVIKPLLVGLIPRELLSNIKKHYYE